MLKTQSQVGITRGPGVKRPAYPLGSRESYYHYGHEGHALTWVVRNPTDDELDAFAHGKLEFALVLEPPLIVVCSRFGATVPWSASAFQWHRVPAAERALPPRGASLEAGVPVTLNLEEAGTGRLLGSRIITLAPEFARVLHEAILEQARFPYDPTEERRALDKLRSRCPIMGALVAYATVRTVATD